MLKKHRTDASRKVVKRKLNFFIRCKPETTLPGGSKVKLKSEKGRTDLIDGNALSRGGMAIKSFYLDLR